MDVMAKGVNFLYAKRFITESYGPEIWEKVVGSLSKDSREIWGDSIMVSSLYPFAAFKEMIANLTSFVGSMKNEELAKIYEHIADQSLNKVYKIFFSFANPSFVIKNYPKLWEKFFNTGKVEVPQAEKGHAILKFTLPEIFLDWLPPACLGYSKKAVEMAGGRGLRMVEVSRKDVSAGQWEIVFDLRWTE